MGLKETPNHASIVANNLQEWLCKLHGDKVVQALLKELAQLNDEDAFNTIDSNKLIHAQMRKALYAISIVKKTR